MAVVAGRGVGSGRAGTTNSTADDIASGSSSVNIGQREDLANFISMITRDETPFISSIGKTKAQAIYHEWQTDELSPPGDSSLQEGSDYAIPTGYAGVSNILNANSITGSGSQGIGSGDSYGPAFAHTGSNRTRLGNYCQINGKAMAISGTRRVIDSAGVADEYAYQLKKRGTELRRDIELAMIHSYKTADGGATRRRSAGYQAWINDPSVVQYVGGWTNSAQVGTGRPTTTGTGNSAVTDDNAVRASSTSAVTDPTRASLSLTDIDQVMQNLYEQGGKANRIMVSPKLRRDFSDLLVTDSGVRRNLDEKGKLRQSVDVYMSDFGDLMIVPNYIMGLNNNVQFYNSASVQASLTNTTNVANFAAVIYDPQWFSMVTLRPLQELDIGQRGDSTVGMMVEEWSFECKNPLGSAAIYGLS